MRQGLYYADLHRPYEHITASIYTTTGEEMNTPISYDSEDNESHEEYSSRIDEEVDNSSDEPQEDYSEAIALVSHTESETPRGRDQWDYYNRQPASKENAEYMRQTMQRLQEGTLPAYETPDHTRCEARRNDFRRLMLLPDYTNGKQLRQERDSKMADCVPHGRPDIMWARQRLYD